MKLIFPGGEHASVELADGVTTIGSGSGNTIVLVGPGVAESHCEITLVDGSASLRALDHRTPTVLNGRQVDAEVALKPGDLLVFGRVGCSVGGTERKVAAAAAPAPAPIGDDGLTRVRATLPRFMLRGVSGVTFGKTFAVTDNAVIGRQPDCDIPVPAEEVSRHHVRLKPTPEGVHVEDLGSANGSYINDKRIQSGLLKPGEELRLDSVRFLLVAPGMDARQQSARPHAAAATPPTATADDVRRSPSPLLAIGIIILGVIAYFALRYFGVF